MLTRTLRKIGTGTASIAQEVAEVQRLLQSTGLSVSMHSAGTTVGKSGPGHARRTRRHC